MCALSLSEKLFMSLRPLKGFNTQIKREDDLRSFGLDGYRVLLVYANGRIDETSVRQRNSTIEFSVDGSQSASLFSIIETDGNLAMLRMEKRNSVDTIPFLPYNLDFSGQLIVLKIHYDSIPYIILIKELDATAKFCGHGRCFAYVTVTNSAIGIPPLSSKR